MLIESRVRLSEVIQRACNREGSIRAYARKIGTSLGAVQGWLECRSVPNTHNLMAIAAAEGYTLDEFLSYLGQSSQSHLESNEFMLYLKQMRRMNKEQLVKIVQAGAELLGSAG